MASTNVSALVATANRRRVLLTKPPRIRHTDGLRLVNGYCCAAGRGPLGGSPSQRCVRNGVRSSKLGRNADYAWSFARRRVLRERYQKRSGPSRLYGERLGKPRLSKDRDAQAVKALGASLPLRAADGADECAIGHPLAVRQQDLRAAALDLGLLSIRRGEIWKRRPRPDARASLEHACISASIDVGVRLRPLGRALRTAERAPRLVVATPLDDPVLAAVRQDDALGHQRSPISQQSTAFCACSRF